MNTQAGLFFYAQIWILICISMVVIGAVLWNISSIEFAMFNNQKVATQKKKISLIYSFRSLFHFQYIRNAS